MKLLPFSMCVLFCLALVLKGCNFIAPLTLIQQFIIARFFLFIEHCATFNNPFSRDIIIWVLNHANGTVHPVIHEVRTTDIKTYYLRRKKNNHIHAVTQWSRKFKIVQAKKNSHNQINQFPFFAITKKAKNQFLNWEKL